MQFKKQYFLGQNPDSVFAKSLMTLESPKIESLLTLDSPLVKTVLSKICEDLSIIFRSREASMNILNYDTVLLIKSNYDIIVNSLKLWRISDGVKVPLDYELDVSNKYFLMYLDREIERRNSLGISLSE